MRQLPISGIRVPRHLLGFMYAQRRYLQLSCWPINCQYGFNNGTFLSASLCPVFSLFTIDLLHAGRRVAFRSAHPNMPYLL